MQSSAGCFSVIIRDIFCNACRLSSSITLSTAGVKKSTVTGNSKKQFEQCYDKCRSYLIGLYNVINWTPLLCTGGALCSDETP